MDDRSTDALLQHNIHKFFPTELKKTFIGNPFPNSTNYFQTQSKLKILKSFAMRVCAEHDACTTVHRY
jgi:hypothetical protein